MKKDNSLHLALAFDQNFIVPFYVTITSIFSNNRDNDIVFHLIATGVSEEEKELIVQYIMQNNAKVFLYEIDANKTENMPINSGSFTPSAYHRLFFPSIVQKIVARIIYLDVDIVVNGNLMNLYQLDMKDYPIAACVDPGIKTRPDLGVVEANTYFNSGVLLIDTREWLKQNITEKSIEYMNNNPEKILFVDQDALNAVLINNWFKIGNRFNLQSGDVPNRSRNELKAFVHDKLVIHFTSSNKPWNPFCTHPLRYMYDFYLSKSPQSITKQYSGLKMIKILIYSYVNDTIVRIYLANPILLKAWRKIRS